MKNAPVLRTQSGAISDMNAALPTPSGTAMSMAMTEVEAVPQMNDSTPNVGLPPSAGFGLHLVLVKRE